MAYESPAPTGLYLSHFLENFLRSRGLAEAQRRSDSGDILQALQGRQLMEEAQVSPDIADLIARGRQPAPIPGAGLAAAGAAPLAPPMAAQPPTPTPTPGDLGQVAIPEGLQVPQPGGGVGTLLPPPAAPRASPFEAVTGGLPPAAVARLLTTNRGQTALKTVEQAERDRREQEDLAAAEGLMGDASKAAQAGDPIAWADKYAAGLRRIKQFGPSATIQEYAIKLREDKTERARAQTFFKAVADADSTYEKDPTPENYQKFLETVTTANESKVGQAFGQKVMENMLSKRLSADPAEHFFFSQVAKGYMDAYQANKVPDEQAIWRASIQAQPAGFARLLQQYAVDPKKSNLPDFVLEMLRLPPAAKDEKVIEFQTAVGRVNQLPQVQTGQVKRNSPEYWTLVIQEKGRLKDIAEGTTKHDINLLRKDALTYEKGVREGTIPLSLKDATLLIERVNTALRSGELEPEAEDDLRRLQSGLVGLANQAAKRGGAAQVAPAEAKPIPPRAEGKPLTTQQKTLKARRDALVAGNFPDKIWADLSPDEKQGISDLIESQMSR